VTSVRQKTKYGLLSALIGTAVVALVGADLAVGASNSHESENAFGCAPDRAACSALPGWSCCCKPSFRRGKERPGALRRSYRMANERNGHSQ